MTPTPVVTHAVPLTPFYCLGCGHAFDEPPHRPDDPQNETCDRCGGMLLQVLVLADELRSARPAGPRVPVLSPTVPPTSEGDEA